MSTATEQLVRWVWSDGPASAPPAVRHAALRHVLDGLGCALAAIRTGEAPPVGPVVAALGGPGEATVLAGDRAPAPAAALANAAALHALDFDDTHADALVHATSVVVPAALAVGEQVGATGRQVVDACIAGYETVTRLGAAVRHGFHARGFHATSVCGVFAITLLAARLGGADERTAVAALGIAGSSAAGSLEFLADGSSTKQLHPGLAAHAGILAARLALAGASGPATILEGERGLFAAYTGRAVTADALVDGLGARWETARSTIKPYPVCQLSHAALDALQAVDGGRPDPATIDRIEVEVPTDSIPVVCEPAATKLAPRTAYDARFSLPWCLAVLLLDGALTVDSFAADRLGRPDARALAGRVQVRAIDPDVAAADAPGHVRVHHVDGSVRTGAVAVSRGGPDRPLDDAALHAKLVGNVGDTSAADALADAVFGLDDAPDTSLLSRALTAAARSRSPEVLTT